MGKRVLVAVDSYSASEASISYGIELAVRMQSSLALLAVCPPGSSRKAAQTDASLQCDDVGQDKWMDRVVAESQQKGVGLEIFVATGRFLEVVTRFVQSQPAVQFVIMAAPKDRESKPGGKFSFSLSRLHHEFEGEILLVEKAGQITRVSDLYLQSSAQETQV